MFSKSIRIFYLYIVSFLAIMAIVISTANLVEKITNYVYPVYYNTYDAVYKENMLANSPDKVISAPDKITENKQIDNAKTTALRDAFTYFAVILVSLFLYTYHWSMIQKERKVQKEEKEQKEQKEEKERKSE